MLRAHAAAGAMQRPALYASLEDPSDGATTTKPNCSSLARALASQASEGIFSLTRASGLSFSCCFFVWNE